MSVQEKIKYYLQVLPKEVTLVAVCKTKPVELIMQAYDAGQRVFGENKAQEMQAKYDVLPKDIQWHMIGHLQRNKVKYLAPFVDLIHSVDSERLLEEINKQAEKNNRIIKVLLQVFIATESSKFGFDAQELKDFIQPSMLQKYPNIQVVGLMGMASFTDNEAQIEQEFMTLKSLFDLYENTKYQNFDLQTLSMGMSGDYGIAIKCGSNMVRIGSDIFGGR